MSKQPDHYQSYVCWWCHKETCDCDRPRLAICGITLRREPIHYCQGCDLCRHWTEEQRKQQTGEPS